MTAVAQRMSEANTRAIRVVFLGSSTTAGSVATTVERRWVNRFIRLAGESAGVAHATYASGSAAATVPGLWGYNLGIAGRTASTYLADRLAEIGDLQPHVVIHMIGSNDYALNGPPVNYRNHLINAVNSINAAVAEPVVHAMVHSYQRVDVTDRAYAWAEYALAMSSAAAATGSTFLDINDEYVLRGVPGTDPEGLLSGDMVHQTDAGHALMADLVFAGLITPVVEMPNVDELAGVQGQITYHACDLRSGRFLEELPLSDVQASVHLGTGQFQATLDLSAWTLPQTGGDRPAEEIRAAHLEHLEHLLRATDPLRRTIVIDEDGRARGEWVITRRMRTTTSIIIAGVELPGLLARVPISVVSDSPGLRYRGWDQIAIARDLILRGLGHWGPGAPRGRVECAVVTEPSGMIRDRFYLPTDGNSVLQRVNELSDVIGGFDWWIETNWGTSSGFKVAARRVRWGYPSAGTWKDVTLDWDQAGTGNVVSIEMEEDGARLATDAVLYGAGEGPTKVIGVARSNVLTDVGYPRLVATRAATSVSTQAVADGHAQSMLRHGTSAESPPTVTVELGRGLTLDDLDRGDRVVLSVSPCPGWPRGWVGWVRVLGWSLPDTGNRLIELSITSLADQPGGD